jgi:hypothetical protein
MQNNEIAGLGRHLGLQEFVDPSISRHMKVAMLPAWAKGDIPGIHFCYMS